MLSWRGAVDGSAGIGGFLILLLLGDVPITPEASSETAFDQQMMQLDECRERHPGRADRHPGAGDRIQHPRRHHRDDTGRRLDVNKATGDTLHAPVQPDAEPK
jgi:hypothetical protein